MIAAVVLGVVLAGCGGPAATASPDLGTFAPLTSPVDGIVVKIDTSGLNDFRGFQLRLDSGQVVAFALGRLENATEFPPSHLPEHMAASDRLRVTFMDEGGTLVVHRIDHATVRSSPGT